MKPESPLRIGMLLHLPKQFSAHSGMMPLAEAVGAAPVLYAYTWRNLMKRSWTVGQGIRMMGNAYYGSEWNALLPVIDEWRLYRAMPNHLDIAHFLWGEFAGPSWGRLFRRKARRLVGTFHASARKLPMVLKNPRSLSQFDAITLMSETQRPFFLEQGVAPDRLHVILHGVADGYFTPADTGRREDSGPLRGILVGYTERDHAFMAEVLRQVPPGVLHMTILAPYDQKKLNYQGVPNASFPEHLDDDALRQAYRDADLVVMPMIDCTANNVILEAMSCGTPVMVNRVGGVPEYVDPACNWIMEGKNARQWVEVLCDLHAHRARLWGVRPRVRAWAERFAWERVASSYAALYHRLLTDPARS